MNLISNAIKYNKPNGYVIVSLIKRENGRVRIGIQDTGCGIPADKQDKIFQPFERLDKEAGEIEGTGIGLTITKQLIESMAGVIGFDSIYQEGSYFYIDIPTSDKSTC